MSEHERTSMGIVTMNVNGKNDELGECPDRRRHTLHNVITKLNPAILMLQECPWKNIRGWVWGKRSIPENYVYIGHAEASIIYDNNIVTVSDVPRDELESILTQLQSQNEDSIGSTIPTEFAPLPRMTAVRFDHNILPDAKFLCISWHGKYNGLSKKNLMDDFRYLMEFLKKIREKYQLPLLIGGDFNIGLPMIRDFVQAPFKITEYSASERRKANRVIDFFIYTEDLSLHETMPIDLDIVTSAVNPFGVLDHDPVQALLTFGTSPEMIANMMDRLKISDISSYEHRCQNPLESLGISNHSRRRPIWM